MQGNGSPACLGMACWSVFLFYSGASKAHVHPQKAWKPGNMDLKALTALSDPFYSVKDRLISLGYYGPYVLLSHPRPFLPSDNSYL